MDSNILLTAFVFLGLVLFLILYNEYQRIKSKRIIKREVEKSFGKNPKKKLPLKNIDDYYQIFGGSIDDITFRDLEVLTFLSRYNHCKSKVGDEIFYYHLRNPKKDKKTLRQLQIQRQKMLEHPDQMKKLQLELAQLGRYNASIPRLLQEGIAVNPAYRIPVYFSTFTIAYILIMIYLLREIAIFPAIGLLILNGFLYNRLKKDTEGHLIDLLHLRQLLRRGEGLVKISSAFFIEEKKELNELLKKVKPLTRSLGGFQMPGSSAMVEMEFAQEYVNALAMSEARRLFKSQKYVDEFSQELFRIYYLMGNMDTQLALASLTLANDVVDVKYEDKALKGIEVHNPLLFETSVANSFDMGKKSMLLTGSNASGKSTFLRTVGLNQLLALTTGFAFAKEYVTDLYTVTSAIDISDSLEKGLSYFMAETVAIKRMIDKEERQLLLLDEIFRGTNTIDRISAATYTLKYLAHHHQVIAATHDIELTELLDREYQNFHFEEQIIQQDIVFDYQLKKGPATSRNAIAILASKNYPKEIIDQAYALAKKMEEKK
ncbi:MAG: DNA mismatch repair protein MutS [Tissierellia bacterium]|nr:DNA mismatch repair protein MutS [Tissierellia bacterium]